VAISAEFDDLDVTLRAVLRPGQRVVLAQGLGTPADIVAALPRHLDRLRGSRLLVGMLPEDFPALPGVHLETFFPSGPLGTADRLDAADAEYRRVSLFELATAIRTGALPVDVALAQAAPPRDCRCSLGITLDFAHAAVACAEHAVLEVVADLPRTGWAGTVELGDRIHLVGSTRHARTTPADPPPSIDRDFGARVASWIPDGAALELGMGRWVDDVVPLLRERRGLRLQTGLLGDWTRDLYDCGAITAGEQSLATSAAGSAEFYRWLDDSQVARLAPADVTHDPRRLARLTDFRAVNSVLEVDLTGAANSERGHEGRLGGLGGLPDFAAGAALSAGGLSVLALRARAGSRSRIVARLPDEHRSLGPDGVDVVVTEYGSAYLRGLDPYERARALIEVAAPELRRELTDAIPLAVPGRDETRQYR
jgi:acyl-CoA hydrolase